MSGIFYCGDNLELLTELELVPPESVDLIYLDPPFNSQRTYNIVYKDSRAQAEAFVDCWTWKDAAPQYAELLGSSRTPPKLKTLLKGLRDLLIETDADLLAYIAMMAPRLFALHTALKPTGSLYLHCDPTASHYLKLLLDAVFGSDRFLSEIIWKRTGAHSSANRPGPVHDVLLLYTKSQEYTWNKLFTPHDPAYIASHYTQVEADGRRWMPDNLTAAGTRNGSSGKPWRGFDVGAKGNHWKFTIENLEALDKEGRIYWPPSGGWPRYKRYLDEVRGTPLQDIWTDIAPLNAKAAERVGYPTQKPMVLLKRILDASSNPGDLVLDPFCGCGTTIETCEQFGRRWVGIDIAARAVEITEQRFEKQDWKPPHVEWYPPDRDAAIALAKRPQGGKKFERWALRKIRAARYRKHDRGIDGEAQFKQADGGTINVVVSVKSGHVTSAMVRELRGTLEREKGSIAAFVTLKPPSKEMLLEATRADYLPISDAEGRIPRLQFVTVDRIFDRTLPSIRCPGVNVTRLEKAAVPEADPAQLSLQLEQPSKPKASRVREVKPPSQRKPGVISTRPSPAPAKRTKRR